MPLLTLLTGERRLERAVPAALDRDQAVAMASCWEGMRRLVRERPVATAMIDLHVLSEGGEDVLVGLRQDFPSLGLIVLARKHNDPVLLFRLGRAGINDLFLLSVENLQRDLVRTLLRARGEGPVSVVLRAVNSRLPRWETDALRLAMDGLHHRWSAEEYAARLGLSRPHLSERLKACRLPSSGHLLVWAKLLHSGQWLKEPGRTAESVSRQLEYSSGAAFRRALRGYTGATPTEVVDRGGLSFVLDCFLRECGFHSPLAPARESVASVA